MPVTGCTRLQLLLPRPCRLPAPAAPGAAWPGPRQRGRGSQGLLCLQGTENTVSTASPVPHTPGRSLSATTYPACLHSKGICGCLLFRRGPELLRLGLLLPETCRSCPARQTPASGHSQHVEQAELSARPPEPSGEQASTHSCLPVPPDTFWGIHCRAAVTSGTLFSSRKAQPIPRAFSQSQEQGSTTLLLTSHPPVGGSVKATGSPLPAAEPWRIPAPAVVRQLPSPPWDSIRILTNEPATPHHLSGQFKSH